MVFRGGVRQRQVVLYTAVFSPHPDNMKTPSVPLLLGVSVLLLSGLTVSADHPLTLKFSEYPVMTGSDVTLYCENVNGDFVKAYLFFNETKRGSEPQNMFTIHKVQRSDEGLYSCSTDEDGKSPQVWLRVQDPPTTSGPRHTTTSSTASTTTLDTASGFNNTGASDTSSSLFFLHFVPFSPYCFCTVRMVSICCSRKKENKPDFSMEMTLDDEDYDDITGVTTNPGLRSA
ncbi:hypothetical protein Q5P01_003150 [Channa striata]|uniref:Immunoglobulin domain-containing protein n=1 Tax=Channa striata TaxID=64152 RepID=A0AA88NNY3_CHASR|nr:hypothetical protein Q5P01_003150 [Channa striata]